MGAKPIHGLQPAAPPGSNPRRSSVFAERQRWTTSAAFVLFLPLSLSVGLASCGRGEVSALGLPAQGGPTGNDPDGGGRDGSSTDGGGPPGPSDGGPWRPDASFDAGSPGECMRPRDCANLYGPPICPNGARGQWQCGGERCNLLCPNAQCLNDCDCPFQEACLGGVCGPAGRMNLCCTWPCPPGASCELPGGGFGMCPSDLDGGTPPIPDSGIRVDSGVPGPADAGSAADASTRLDGSLVLDASVSMDAGPIFTPVGAPCTDQGGCGPVGFCVDESSGFPGGYCVEDCSALGSMCPPGSVCENFGRNEAYCLDQCTSVSQCRPEYGCVRLGIRPERVCWPLPEGSTNPMGSPVGSACMDDQQCATGLSCLFQGDWPDGYCSRPYCDTQTNPCPNDSACYSFPGSYSLCLASCPSGGEQSTCRAGYYCLGPTGQPGACVPN